MKTEEQLRHELEIAENEHHERFNSAPEGMDFNEFTDYMSGVNEKCSRISRELRMIQTPVFDELSTFGDVMSLKDFIDYVNSGGFIDYDGYGHYVRDGKESDITIKPSDVSYGKIRKDFDTIIWFNR